MGRSAEDEKKQDQCITFISSVGLISFVVCFFPVVFDLEPNPKDIQVLVSHSISRIAAVSATLPLLWGYAYDVSLPQRLTYPRTLLLLALLVPNATILLMSIPTLNQPPIKVSVCFSFGMTLLFNCGLLAYVAGEASSKRLLVLLTFTAVWGSLWNIYFTFKVFITSPLSDAILLLIIGISSLLIFVMMVWYAREMKTLDERRRMFAMTYIIAIGAHTLLKMSCYVTLTVLDRGGYVQDGYILVEILTATGISIITSKMAHRDADIALVGV